MFVILCGILYQYGEYILPKPKWKEKELGDGREIQKKKRNLRQKDVLQNKSSIKASVKG